MKKTIIMVAMSIAMAFTFTAIEAGDKCVNCSSSSNGCQQCRLGGKDTSDARKRCEKMGCKITGTGSCSTAANVKVCG